MCGVPSFGMSFARPALTRATAVEYSRRLGLHGGFHEPGPSMASSSSGCLTTTLQRLHMRLTTSCRRFGDHLQTTQVRGESKAIIGRPIHQGIAVIRGAVGWATPTRVCRLQLGRITACMPGGAMSITQLSSKMVTCWAIGVVYV